MISSTEAAQPQTDFRDVLVRSRPTPPVALGWCLIASGDSWTRELLERAARNGGWRPRVCASAGEALREAFLHHTPLALIDVGSVEDRCVHSDLIRVVREHSKGLVVICDRSEDAAGEVWAREQGAWVYLPDIDDRSDIASVCLEARELMREKQPIYPSGSVT